VVEGELRLEASQAQAPGRLRGPVFEPGLVQRGLAVGEAAGTRRIEAEPEFLVVLAGVQPRGHAPAGVPAAAQLAPYPEARAGTPAVGVGGRTAAGTGFGGEIAEADVAAGLPAVRLHAGSRQCQGENRDGPACESCARSEERRVGNQGGAGWCAGRAS